MRLFDDPVFMASLYHSLYFLAVTTACAIPLALGISLLLNEDIKGRTVGRVLLLLPWATPPVVVSLMFNWIFDANMGIINFFLLSTGLTSQKISFYSTPSVVLNSLVIVFVWKVFTLYSIIFLSSLQNIPHEIIESSKVYGARSFKRFRYIIFPYLKPTMVTCIILNGVLSLLYSFDIVIAITKGGPGYESYMLAFYAYLQTFWYLDIGYGSTIAYFTTIVAVLFAFVALRWYKIWV
jgi:ABC-type sugar transport system permease subunit